jgi:RNA ligase (TIGR02306 family)
MEKKRALASIQVISNIENIENADRLEYATILGWHCVVKKGDFKVNDKVLYLEIDSFLPIRPEFEFMRKQYYRKWETGTEGFRVKTIRLRGKVSQGLVMPIHPLLPEGEYEIGQDVTDALRVIKYEPPIPKCLQGLAKGTYPSYLIKSDETRAQILQEVLKRRKGTICYYTEKIDGSSGTYYIKDGVYGVTSRNVDFKVEENPNNIFVKMGIQYDIEKKLRSLNKNIMIQGEVFGRGIQENHLNLDIVDIMFYNALDIDICTYYDYKDFVALFKELDLKTVPILKDDYVLTDNIDELVKIATGISVISPNRQREGIVIRPLKEVLDLGMSVGMFTTNRFSFKVINPEFLIDNDA